MGWFLFGGEKEKKEPSVFGAVKEAAAETAEALLSGDAMKPSSRTTSSSTDTKTGTDEALTMGLTGRFHALCKEGNAQDITWRDLDFSNVNSYGNERNA